MKSDPNKLVRKMLGEDAPGAPAGPRKMIVVKLEDIAPPMEGQTAGAAAADPRGLLWDEISDIEGDDPLLVDVRSLPVSVDESLQDLAVELSKELIAQGITHIYTG
jgi:hypothetical protein